VPTPRTPSRGSRTLPCRIQPKSSNECPPRPYRLHCSTCSTSCRAPSFSSHKVRQGSLERWRPPSGCWRRPEYRARELTNMQPMNRANETGQFWRQEHYRLHCAENWPDSPYKAAVLAAVHSALERLEATATEPFDPPACMVCATRRPPASVIIFPSRPKGSPDVWKPAA